jgi:hypothetical protein
MQEFRLPIKFLWQLLNKSLSEAKVYILGYRSYTALLSQTGTDAPVATVLENTIGNIVWTRESVGKYRGTLTGAFTLNKVIMTPFIPGYEGNADNGVFLPLGQGTSGVGPEFYYTMFIGGIGNDGEDYIALHIYDNLLDNLVEFDQVLSAGLLPIEIRVYN